MVSSVYCIVGLYHNIVKPCHKWGLRKIDYGIIFIELRESLFYRQLRIHVYLITLLCRRGVLC